ncbi:DUF3290 family protein [Nicoliella spurrieriana]|uniref:DUF3290 family protein n=1 Tax=Nicoliella spurrieriana TaxID=2925830 RepID=A0A976RSR8_9LACO|nr:DUF3290 family protein [Nicoliella spurrieriana]UQS86916.1 DUF3290 family protein [Nicoliella spurrieriana]
MIIKLYSYQYLTHNSHLLDYLFIGVGLLISAIIIVIGIKYARDRTNLKFRNILIVMFAFAAALICLEVGKLQNQASTRSDSIQIARIMQRISKDQHVPIKDIYSSSPTITKQLVMKVKDQYYEVNINATTDVYSTKRVHPFASHIQYVQSGAVNLSISGSQYLNIAGKLLIGFLMLVFQINLSGKGNLDPSNAVDELQNYVLGGIVGGTVFNLGISILEFIVIILIWTMIIFSSKVLIDESSGFKNLMNGSPKVLISKGRIDVATALKSGVSASQLVFKLNNSGVTDLQQVSKVTLEQNGELNINNYHDTVTNLPVITDGDFNDDVLDSIHHDRKWLVELLHQQNRDIKDVYLGQIVNGDLLLTLYPKQGEPLTHFLPNEIIHLKDELTRH